MPYDYILVADDKESDRARIHTLLQERGHRVVTVEDGTMALRVAQSHPPGMVIADVNMPGLNGLNLLTALRRQQSTIPVILLSKLESRLLDRVARSQGAVYLSKVAGDEPLLQTVDRALNRTAAPASRHLGSCSIGATTASAALGGGRARRNGRRDSDGLVPPDRVIDDLPPSRLEMLQQHLAPISEGVCLIDPRGAIVELNAAGQRILGSTVRPGVSLLSQPAAYGLTPCAEPAAAAPNGPLLFERLLRDGVPIEDAQFRLERPDGPMRYLLVSAVPVRDVRGTIEAGMAVLRDITEVKVQEQRLREQTKALEYANECLLRQMRLAEHVQRSILPRSLPRLAGVQFGAVLRPSQHLAGDFYNVLRLDHDRVGFYLGDVMGHGPAAALISVFVMQTLGTKRIEGSTYEILGPAEVLERLSRDVKAAEFPGQPFLTMIYGVLDVRQRTWTYCGGGHPPALLLRRGEAPVQLPSDSPPLGVIDAPLEQREVVLQPGDHLVLYSDGVDSAHWGPHGQGIHGLSKLLEPRDDRSAQDLVDAAVKVASHGDGPSDDIALLVVRITD